MKVILVNGSPHEKGCTFTALCEIEKVLREEGIETEIFWIGIKPISSCIACGMCNKLGKCAIDDVVNGFVDKAKSADGFIFGSPVHYAGATGAMSSFLSRAFYSDKQRVFDHKPASVICSARRAGTTATYDQLIKFLGIKNMPIISADYWNMVHGSSPEQVKEDKEGMHTMRTLGKNLAYYLKLIELGKKNGIVHPEINKTDYTNFIR